MLKALDLNCIGDDRYRNATDGVRNNVILLKYLAEKAKAPLWPSVGKPAATAAAVDPARFDVFPEIEKDIFKTSSAGQQDEDEDMDADLQPDAAIAELLRPNPDIQEQSFRFLLVMDFEATCIKDQKIEPQEIIEIPVLKVDTRTMEPIGEFHTYVRPVKRPRLSPFCTKLTKITQAQVSVYFRINSLVAGKMSQYNKTLYCDIFPATRLISDHLGAIIDFDSRFLSPVQCDNGDVVPPQVLHTGLVLGVDRNSSKFEPRFFRLWLLCKKLPRMHRTGQKSGP